MCFQPGGAAQFRRPLADLRGTFQVPRGMVPMTVRGQNGPITCAVLLTTGAAKASSTPRGTGRFSRALTPEYRAMNTMMAAGCSAGRIGLTCATPNADGGSCRRGDRPRIPTLLYVLQRRDRSVARLQYLAGCFGGLSRSVPISQRHSSSAVPCRAAAAGRDARTSPAVLGPTRPGARRSRRPRRRRRVETDECQGLAEVSWAFTDAGPGVAQPRPDLCHVDPVVLPRRHQRKGWGWVGLSDLRRRRSGRAAPASRRAG